MKIKSSSINRFISNGHRHREEARRGDAAISLCKSEIASPLARNDKNLRTAVSIHSQRGITMIEVILVLVILAIGVAIGIPSMGRMQEQRAFRDASESLEVIADAMRKYESETTAEWSDLGSANWGNILTALESRGVAVSGWMNKRFDYGKQAGKNNSIEIYAGLLRGSATTSVVADRVIYRMAETGRAGDCKRFPWGTEDVCRATHFNDF